MAKVKRVRPVLTVTMDPDLLERLYTVHAALPGATLSGVVEELMEASLPMFEAMVAALQEAKGDDGVVDDDRAKDAIAKWAGAQLLGLSDLDDSAAVRQRKRVAGKEK